MTSASILARENARLFLSGLQMKGNKIHSEVKQREIFGEIIKLRHWPLNWSDEIDVGNICQVSSSYVQLMARTLRQAGWDK